MILSFDFYTGLHKFAEGLSDIRDALIECEETAIIEDLNKFIKDLIACIEGNCVNFGIDLSVEVVILYEHIYEIYGDIQAATNCFKVDAYKQGMVGASSSVRLFAGISVVCVFVVVVWVLMYKRLDCE